MMLQGKRLTAQRDLYELWLCNPDVIRELYEDGPVQTTGIEHDLFIFPDERIGQHLELFVACPSDVYGERKRRDRPDDTSRQLLGLFSGCKGGALGLKVALDPVQVDAAIAGDVGQAVDIFLLPQPHLDHDRFDRLFESIAANLGDELRPPFGLMLDDAIERAFLVQQHTELFMDVSHHRLNGFVTLYRESAEKIKTSG